MNEQKEVPQSPPAQPGNRSEGLLPTDDPAPDLEIAEEVAFDLQSDGARRVGAMPPDTPVSKPGEAVAQTLKPEERTDTRELDEAIERAVPPSV